MLGATQIKLTAGGGVLSPYGPLDLDHIPRRSFVPRSKPPKSGEPT